MELLDKMKAGISGLFSDELKNVVSSESLKGVAKDSLAAARRALATRIGGTPEAESAGREILKARVTDIFGSPVFWLFTVIALVFMLSRKP